MTNNNNGFKSDALSPILVILVAGSISLAIVNKENHPAYFDIVKIAMAYSFGSFKSHKSSKNSHNQDDADNNEVK
ncbi:hypothetical protein [Anabaena sp. CCY 9910]|uniref:hypothetical protein n=1 Tax=Anabaena sp. CCY 9910 TaxID=3103870 RepID=UPI0039E1040F